MQPHPGHQPLPVLQGVEPIALPSFRPLAAAARRLDEKSIAWMSRHSGLFLRISLGIIFGWFGVLKFFPGFSPAEDLATRTISTLTFGAVGPQVSIVVLAAWECAIGMGLILGIALRATLVLLFAQMLGTLTPIVLFPGEVFSHGFYAPTLEGQYIIKNLVLISAGIAIGGRLRSGSSPR